MNAPVTARRVVVTGNHALADAIVKGLVTQGASVARLPHDLPSEADVDRAFTEADDALGGIDQIIHTWMAAPLFERSPFDLIAEPAWAESCEATLAVAWWVARHARRSLRTTHGSLTFVVPTVGLSGAAGFAMLAAVAEGVRVLAKGCARQWGRDSITVNTVATSPHHWVSPTDADALDRSIALSNAALGGPGDAAADLAPLIALLADPDAHFLTSATLVADGGLWMGL